MSTRPNANTQGRPLRPPLASNKSTGSPLTPRLAANVSTPTSSSAAKRPAIKTAVGTRGSAPPEDRDTPVKAFVGVNNITPRSATRKKGGSPFTTPTTGKDDTPSYARAKSPLAAPSVNGFSRPASSVASRDNVPGPRPKSVVGGRERTKSPPLVRAPGYTNGEQARIDQVVRGGSPMFFHANEAKQQEPAVRPGLPKKTPTFVYANGQEEESRSTPKPPSPVLSAVPDRRTSGPFLNARGDLEPALTTPLISPSLSALLARSPFAPIPSPVTTPLHSPSPPGQPDQLQNAKTRAQSVVDKSNYFPAFAATATPIITQAPQRKGSLVVPHTRSGHGKSSSMSVISVESPNSSRRRSATWTELVNEASPSKTKNSERMSPRQAGSPILSRLDTGFVATSPSLSDLAQSPTKAVPDLAAGARRERKVLDLEISNSSLLAINRSLEREMKKQKAELKRFRRLSRAGHFAAAAELPNSRLNELEEQDLPSIDGDDLGRPSSPFEEDVSEMSSNDGSSLGSSGGPDGDARHRAKDEERLKSDLRKHRELLLDTARMNQSLQRCLLWTEDLIKDGKKALDHRVLSRDVQLGGHILSDDEEVDESPPGSRGGEQNDHQEDVDGQNDDFAGVEAFLGIGPWRATAGSGSLSGNSERDSGVEIDKPLRTFQARAGATADPRVELSRVSVGETF